MKKKLLYGAISSFFILSNTYAFAEDESIKINGNILLRSEFDARDFNNNTSSLFFTSMRTSLSAEKEFFDKVKFFVQIRDSRIMGQEKDTLSNSANIDLHQGYIEFKNIFFDGFSAKIGRFENNFGTQRFIGAVDWHYIARSFDGARLSYSNKDLLNLKIDAFSFMHNTNTPYIGNANPKIYKDTNPLNYDLHGLWANFEFNEHAKLDLFTIYQRDSRQTNPNISDLNLLTLGLNYKGNYGNFSSLVECAYQSGNTKNLSTNAYLLSAQGFYNIFDFKFGIGADILSGNNPNSKNTFNVFTVPFGTNHLFYGFMDYFINIPANTMNLGLNDYYFTSLWKPTFLPVNFGLNTHYFTSNQLSNDNKINFGQEIDFTINYPFTMNNFKNSITFGTSVFNPGELMRKDEMFGNNVNSPGVWSYLMLVSNF
ncbi:MAG: hypothetical protein KatS3mg068_0403 [Candidatus Sericytochromatia bacterium]|nr:MAG: hypothetical protein KatS3mg068_0403 [Candidatus Sericytochromatia bacterium]